MIDHNIFCKKLEKFGFGYNEINWCKHYLGCRKQCVKLSGVLSSALDVSCGVPKGSILGPLFFIMYVNDLLMNFENCDVNILLYADDTVVYYAYEHTFTACKTVENKLKDIEEWCSTNKLTIYVGKTKQMLFQTTTGIVSPTVRFVGNILDNVKHYNYLRVISDHTLSCDLFLKEKYNKNLPAG